MSIDQIRADVIRRTNHERAAHHCPALSASPRLHLAAQRHADDMSRKHYFSHISADGTSWIRRILRTGFKQPAGENIAFGQHTAAEVVSAWMNSPEHRRNILDPNFRRVGIGFTTGGDFWVQDFGY